MIVWEEINAHLLDKLGGGGFRIACLGLLGAGWRTSSRLVPPCQLVYP